MTSLGEIYRSSDADCYWVIKAGVFAKQVYDLVHALKVAQNVMVKSPTYRSRPSTERRKRATR